MLLSEIEFSYMEFTRERSYDSNREENALVSWFLGSSVNIESREAIMDNVSLTYASTSSDQEDANEAIKRAYSEELKRREEAEIELKKTREAFEKMRIVSENRITESHLLVINLQEKYNLAMEVLRRAKKDRDELKTERKIAILEAEGLKRRIHGEKMMMISRSDEQREAPQYFICPISQEVMEDPQVAADGFTYEAKAISSWFERGHETSPMTNTKLVHIKLVPNLALRSAIQEWLHAPSSSSN